MSSPCTKWDWYCLATGKIAPAGPTGALHFISGACGNGRASVEIKIQMNWTGPQTSFFMLPDTQGSDLICTLLHFSLILQHVPKKGRYDGISIQVWGISKSSLRCTQRFKHTQRCTHSNAHAHTIWGDFLFCRLCWVSSLQSEAGSRSRPLCL